MKKYANTLAIKNYLGNPKFEKKVIKTTQKCVTQNCTPNKIPHRDVAVQ